MHAPPVRASGSTSVDAIVHHVCARDHQGGLSRCMHEHTYREEGSVNLHDPHLVQRKWIAFYLKPGAGQVFYGVRYDLARPVWRICLVLHANWT